MAKSYRSRIDKARFHRQERHKRRLSKIIQRRWHRIYAPAVRLMQYLDPD
jgi:hypothetical protein